MHIYIIHYIKAKMYKSTRLAALNML